MMKAAFHNGEFRCRLVFFARGVAGVGLQVNVGRKMVGSVFMTERDAVELRRQINNAIDTIERKRDDLLCADQRRKRNPHRITR